MKRMTKEEKDRETAKSPCTCHHRGCVLCTSCHAWIRLALAEGKRKRAAS